MKSLVLAAALLATTATLANAQLYGTHRQNSFGSSGYGYGTGSNPNSNMHNGYTTDRGTYVAPHYQTNPNSTTLDNYNTRGNYNPYTGRTGTRSPY